MADKHASTQFPVFGVEVDKLFNSRYRVSVRCNVKSRNKDWYYGNVNNFFKSFGDLYTSNLEVDGVQDQWEALDGEAYPNMRLINTNFGYIQGVPYPVLTLIYETLPDTFTQEVADKVDYELNGLRRVTRSVIAKDGASYTKIVGTTQISHNEHGQGPLTLTLASAVEDAKGAEEGGYVRYIETWLESGLLDVSTSPGPANIPGTTRVTHVSIGTPSIPTGPLIESKDINQGGFVRYIRTTLQGTIIGTKQTYKDVVSVEVPGTVECTTKAVSGTYTRTFGAVIAPVTISGTIAVPSVTPRRQKRVEATVTVEITTTPPDTGSTAYDLGAISCSVSSTNTAISGSVGGVGTVGGVEVLGGAQSFSANSRIQTYPGCYLTSSSSEGTIEYLASSREADGALYSIDTERKTYCDGAGSTAADGYVTTGIIKRESRPVLVLQDGTTYYEVITWSVA